MKDQNCSYCMREEKPEIYSKFGYPVCALPSGYVFLFREQSKRGRVILAYKDHVDSLMDLSDSDRAAFFNDVAKLGSAVRKIFNPDKINFGMYADTAHHMHMHIVPKYKDGDEWGGTFQMNPNKVFLTEDEYEKMAQQIREALNA